MYAIKEMFMRVLVKVTCLLLDVRSTFWASQFLCLAACGDMLIRHFISKLMTEPHWLFLSTAWLECPNIRTRLGLSSGGVHLPVNFTVLIFLY